MADKLKLDEYDDLNERVKRLNSLMWVGFVVLFIGFSAMFGTVATLVISHFDNSQATFQALEIQVQELNNKTK